MIFIAALILAMPILAYCIGAFPTGLVVVRQLKGIDIRTIGSGNIGATNVKRVLGTGWFVIVLVLDAAKAAGAVLLARFFYSLITTNPMLQSLFSIDAVPVEHIYIIVIAACVILGNMFNVFLEFNGGKGIGHALGILFALTPLPVLVCLSLFIAIVALSRYLSLGSLAATTAYPFIVFFLPGLTPHISTTDIMPYLLFAVVLSTIVILKHIANIQRLVSGTENTFSLFSAKRKKKKPSRLKIKTKKRKTKRK